MAGFKGTRNINGRPRGAVNKTTAETKELLQKIISNELDNIEQLLNKLDPKERLDAVIKLLPYIIPKQTEIIIEPKENKHEPLTITLINENENHNQ